MFVREGLILTATGLACGLAVAYAVTRLMSSLLFEVSPVDPLTYAAVSLVLLSAGLISTWLPARRATMVDASTALRAE